VFAVLPPIYPEWLGERGFTAAHGVRFPYVIGEMARGIATARMTVEGVRAGVMGFFGSAGLDLGAVEAGVREIQDALGREAGGWGANLIHNIQDDGLEIATVDLLHRLGVRCVSASAFMRLTPAIVLYSVKGLRRGPDGQIIRAGRIFAKVSRDEVAGQFLSPAPEAMLRALVAEGRISRPSRASIVRGHYRLAQLRGGHTDNRALTVLLRAPRCATRSLPPTITRFCHVWVRRGESERLPPWPPRSPRAQRMS
jgi:PfaD family protein